MFLHLCVILFTGSLPNPPSPDADPPVQTPLGLGRPLAADPPRCRPPWMQTPWGWADSPPKTRGWADHPLGCRSPLLPDADPQDADPPVLGRPLPGCIPPPDTVNKRAVSILLGCLLVIESFAFTSSKLDLENPSSCWTFWTSRK